MDLFEEMFGYIPEGHRILLWTLPDKRSVWLEGPGEMPDYREQFNQQGKDAYFGVGLAPAAFVDNLDNPAAKRCPQDHITGITALWADIDVQGEAHAQDNLPPDKQAAMRLISDIPLEPTCIVDSGNGFQCWWLLQEPWVWETENQEERDEAKDLVKSWIYTIRSIAHDRHNWDIDCTIDLSRVMRLPGTQNHKTEPPKDVEIKQADWQQRYNLETFYQHTVDLDYVDLPACEIDDAIDYEVGELELDPQAEPPAKKWSALMQIEPKVVESFNHNREDIQDQSPSGYDMSLANYCVQADWTDQEITNLLIAHRRHNGCDLKLREDYYKRTIRKARTSYAQEQSEERLEDMADKAKDVQNEEVNEQTEKEVRQHILKYVSNLFGIRIKRFVKYTSDPPQYKLETGQGTTMIGSGKSVLRQSTFRSKIFEATNQVIPKFKGEKWQQIVQALGNAVEEESLGEEATNKGVAKQWLGDYLNEKPVMNWQGEDPADIVTSKNPFHKNGTTYIFGADFRRWLRVSEMEKISAKQMGTILRSYGCRPDRVNVRLDGERTSRSVWRLPDSINN